MPSKRGQTLEVAYPSSNPAKADTDGDGLDDSVETGRDVRAFVADSDYDGLDDGAEVLEFRTDPLTIDTDGDGLSDGTEAEPIRIASSNRRIVQTAAEFQRDCERILNSIDIDCKRNGRYGISYRISVLLTGSAGVDFPGVGLNRRSTRACMSSDV